MSGIERFFAGLLLAGAVGGAAAFAHGIGGGPEKTTVAPLLQPAHHADSSTIVRIEALPGVPAPLGAGPAVASIRNTARPAVPPVRLATTQTRPLVIGPVVHETRAAAPAPKSVQTARVAPEPAPAAPATPPAPAPTPAPAAQPAPAPAPTPAPLALAPQQQDTGHGNGKAKGHDKQHGKKNDDATPPTLTPMAVVPAQAATETVAAEVAPTPPVLQDDAQGDGHGNHGRGHGNDK